MPQTKIECLENPLWQREMASAVTDPAELLSLLELPRDLLAGAIAASAAFRLRVPRAFIARMARGDPDDPLLRQVLPLAQECQRATGFSDDPVGDRNAVVSPGLLHKYHGRVLIVATAACGIHCRYCFRRHFPYNDNNPLGDDWRKALDYIAADSSIREVILSGGDPLSLSDSRLAMMVEDLQMLPHCRRIRLHTRQPIVIPSRITHGLIQILTQGALQTVMVVHINHANELNDSVYHAMEQLRQAGIPLFNQAVLLKGVNDSADSLITLSEALSTAGITPYYLHQLDKVAGAAHFSVSQERALAIYSEMRQRLPGYLLPRLVTEQAGAASKLTLT
ncbi:MAG: EF-P beta-lysylation protein EpmB [Gammaproteobacteria bacterium]|nr:MAG: EF-P beta-lysylation protein EpmB [Gammaproteobacteria bacterium]